MRVKAALVGAAVALAAAVWALTGPPPAAAQIFPTTTTTEVLPTTTTTRPRPSTTTTGPVSTTTTTRVSTSSTDKVSSSTTASTAPPRTSVPVLPPVSLSPAEAEDPPAEAQGSGDINALFPLLSLLGFGVVAAMVGTRWWLTRN